VRRLSGVTEGENFVENKGNIKEEERPSVSLARHRQHWEELGELDPFWAILSRRDRKYGKWDIEEFFLTGEEEIRSVMSVGDRLGLPAQRHWALDFGCGVGRLTRPLSKYFKSCCGVDISLAMLRRARELNQQLPNCLFLVNGQDHLRVFRDSCFDLVLSYAVLQHMPRKEVVFSYISEFFRILKKDGLLVIELPERVPLKHQIHQLRARTYQALRRLRVSSDFLYRTLGISPMTMLGVAETEVRKHLAEIGAKVLEVEAHPDSCNPFRTRRYSISK
jgi:ubiquinone/menaquinone biosynthesis C-methylase UbiE